MKKLIYCVVFCINFIYPQSTSIINFKQNLNHQKSITNANDLADGDLLLKPKQVNTIITVGGPTADISGFTSSAIQVAVDAINSRGGGIVKLFPGIYKIYAPIRLTSNMELIGSGDSTILKKVDGYR